MSETAWSAISGALITLAGGLVVYAMQPAMQPIVQMGSTRAEARSALSRCRAPLLGRERETVIADLHQAAAKLDEFEGRWWLPVYCRLTRCDPKEASTHMRLLASDLERHSTYVYTWASKEEPADDHVAVIVAYLGYPRPNGMTAEDLNRLKGWFGEYARYKAGGGSACA